MTADVFEQDWPSPRHDLRCRIWLEPIGDCTCRPDDGHDAVLTTADRLELLAPMPVELLCDTDIEEAS